MTDNQTTITAAFLRSIPTDDAIARAYFNGAAAEIDRLTRRLAQYQRASDAGLDNLRDARMSMLLIREAVETLGPVGALRSGEHICCTEGPTFHAEAMEIISGIQAIWTASGRQHDLSRPPKTPLGAQ